MGPVRSCSVSVTDRDGAVHTVQVHALSLFEAAAAALAAFREEAWCAGGIPPNARLRVEVHLPSVVHDVPMKAVERWLRSPSASPREEGLKNAARHPSGGGREPRAR